MDEPILEALAFDLESDLSLVLDPSTKSGDCNTSNSHGHNKYSTSRVLFNSFISTPCMFPDCDFISTQPLVDKRGKKQYDEYILHLNRQHNFVILEINSIANLHKYTLHWKKRFVEKSFKEFCTLVPVAAAQGDDGIGMELDGASTNSDLQKLGISLDLAEDKQLRNKLWTGRLEAVLEVSRFEREEADSTIQCLFCKEICRGNRTNLLNHMFDSHSFHIGKADNIVFIQELMQFLAETMSKLQCIFCEKTFKDRTVMREHMRKKQHKMINPSNPDYDIYYLVNYLEPGKTWQALDEEDAIDERKEEEWIETREEITSIVCLFCSTQAINFDMILLHMNDVHKFNFERLTEGKSFYEKVKIVNFIRRNMHHTLCFYCEMKFLEKTSLAQHIETQHHETQSEFPSSKVWNRAEYFFPTYENDQFLILLENDYREDEDGTSLESSEAEEIVIAEEVYHDRVSAR